MKTGLTPPEPEKKPAVKSRSLWGTLLNFLPVALIAEKSLDLPTGIFDELLTSGYAAYVAVAGFVGLVLQVWGRLKANPNISGLFRVKE